MKVINKDMTRESVKVFITNNQVYARIFAKSHGKWEIHEYFQSYDWEIDQELIKTTIRYIKRTWGLSNPKVEVV